MVLDSKGETFSLILLKKNSVKTNESCNEGGCQKEENKNMIPINIFLS